MEDLATGGSISRVCGREVDREENVMRKRKKWLIAVAGGIALLFAGKVSVHEVVTPVGDNFSQTEDLTVGISPPSEEMKTRTPLYDYDSLQDLHFQFWAHTPKSNYARLEVEDVVVTARGHADLTIDDRLTDYPENMVFKEDTWGTIQAQGRKQFAAYYFYWPKKPSEPFRLLGNQAKINVKARISVRSTSNELLTTRRVESNFILERKYWYVPWWITVLIPRF